MKRFFIFLALMLTSTLAYADWYIFDTQTNQCIGKSDKQPDQADLDKRQEFSFFTDKDMSIEKLEYFKNDIRVRPDTKEEAAQKEDDEVQGQESTMIHQRMEKIAYEQLKADGVIFKHFTDEDFKDK